MTIETRITPIKSVTKKAPVEITPSFGKADWLIRYSFLSICSLPTHHHDDYHTSPIIISWRIIVHRWIIVSDWRHILRPICWWRRIINWYSAIFSNNCNCLTRMILRQTDTCWCRVPRITCWCLNLSNFIHAINGQSANRDCAVPPGCHSLCIAICRISPFKNCPLEAYFCFNVLFNNFDSTIIRFVI